MARLTSKVWSVHRQAARAAKGLPAHTTVGEVADTVKSVALNGALLVGAVWLIAQCAGCTMTKPDMTPESKAQDRYECERQAYQAAGGNALLLSNGLYRDCMRARGYK